MIRYVLEKDVKWVYPVGSDYEKEDRIPMFPYSQKDIFVDVIRVDSGIMTAKLFLPNGNCETVEIPQSQFMDCLRLKDCDDLTNCGRVGLPLVPECLFDGRFNGE